ncbi:MAG: thermonuclease family protein, partial [Gammaproteobacteria bacterium]
KVLDGDTVELRSGKRVRLLGINAPETAKRGKSGEAGGEAARETLRDWIEGRWVTLEVGPEPEDRYGRMLAFVHDDEGRLINAELLRAGLAHSYFFLPRIVHEQALLAAETEARAARRGIWSRAEGRVFSPAALTDAQNRFRQVRGRVSHERADAEFRFVFLDRTLGLRVARTLDFVPRGLTGRTLLARGKIRRIKGALWMDIRHPSQLVLDPPPVQDKGRPSP